MSRPRCASCSKVAARWSRRPTLDRPRACSPPRPRVSSGCDPRPRCMFPRSWPSKRVQRPAIRVPRPSSWCLSWRTPAGAWPTRRCSDGNSQNCTAAVLRVSEEWTDAPPRAECSPTTRPRPGPSSSPNNGCGLWCVSPTVPKPSSSTCCGGSSRSRIGSNASQRVINRHHVCMVICGRGTGWWTRRDAVG